MNGPLPDSITLHSKRWPYLLIALGATGLALLAWSMGGKYIALAGGILFAVAGLVLLIRPAQLTLDRDGFSHRNILGQTKRFRWADCGLLDLTVTHAGREKTLGLQVPFKVISIVIPVADRDYQIGEFYPLPKQELANLIESFRRRAAEAR